MLNFNFLLKRIIPLKHDLFKNKKSNGLPSGFTMLEAFKNAFNLGYCGHYPWTSNGVDDYGSLSDFGDASLIFMNNHKLIK